MSAAGDVQTASSSLDLYPVAVERVYDACVQRVVLEACASFEPECLGEAASALCTVISAACSVSGAIAPPRADGIMNLVLTLTADVQFSVIGPGGMQTTVTGTARGEEIVTLCAPSGSTVSCAVLSSSCGPAEVEDAGVCAPVHLCVNVEAVALARMLLPVCGLVVPVPCAQASRLAASPRQMAPGQIPDPVAPAPQSDWQPYLTSPDGFVGFVFGPGTPPAGVGSAELSTGTDGAATAELRNPIFAGTRLRDLTCFVYWTYDRINNGSQWPFIMLDINYTGGEGVDDLLFFEPTFQNPAGGSILCPDQGLPVLDTWQRWNALGGCWWSANGTGGLNPGTGVKPLSHYLAVVPDATIVNFGALGGVRLVHGQASPEDVFDGNVDLASIGVGPTIYTYNFEPVAPPGPPGAVN